MIAWYRPPVLFAPANGASAVAAFWYATAVTAGLAVGALLVVTGLGLTGLALGQAVVARTGPDLRRGTLDTAER